MMLWDGVDEDCIDWNLMGSKGAEKGDDLSPARASQLEVTTSSVVAGLCHVAFLPA